MKLVPTKVSFIATLTLVAASLGWALVQLWPTWFDQNLEVPWLAALTMCVVAVSLLVWSWMMKPKLQPKQREPRADAILAARTAALAMAASRVGGLMGGLYFGILLANLPNASAPAPRERVLISGITALAALATIVIALWLERMCRLPKPPVEKQANAVS